MKNMISVVLTIDTEPDDAWTNHRNPSVANVQELLRLQELLGKHGAKATCLATYRVIQDEAAVAVLRELVEKGGAEIGAHLHPWETPPFMESGVDVRYAAYPHELPLDIFSQKLEHLTEAITERFGRPTAYRAGRWGLSSEHLPILERLGYEIDTSVIPMVDWRGTMGIPADQNGRGGPDYRRALRSPYHPDYADACGQGASRLLEVPVTVSLTRRFPTALSDRFGQLPVLLQRALRKLRIVEAVHAIPADASHTQLMRMIKVLLAAQPPVINIALHSSELVVGGSPSSQTRAAVSAVFDKIEAMLAALRSSGVCEFMTLSDVARRHATRTASDSPPTRVRVAEAGHKRQSFATVKGHRHMRELAYILSPSYSGSTLLTFLLGTHPDIATIGELKATRMGDVEQYVCSCGARIRRCPFWRRVEEVMAERAVSFSVSRFGSHFSCAHHDVVARLLGARVRGAMLEAIRDVCLWALPTARRELRSIVERNRDLIDVTSSLQRAELFVDASKDSVRLRHLLRTGHWNIRVIYLIRDGRGATSSFMRHHSTTMKNAAREWAITHKECRQILMYVPQQSWLTIRYEQLCKDPKRTLHSVLSFLGVDRNGASQDYRSVEHHIVGNYMRLKSNDEITLDEKWKARLTKHDLRVFDRIAGRINRQLGYE